MEQDIITPATVDKIYLWPAGRAQRLAKRGKLPCYILPDGAVRFRLSEIQAMVKAAGPLPPGCASFNNETGGRA